MFTKTSYLFFMSCPRSSVMPFRTADFASSPGFQIHYNTSDPSVLADWHEMLCSLIAKGLFRFLSDNARVGHFPYPGGKEHLKRHVKNFV